MGYTTLFDGSLKSDRPFEPWFKDYVNSFSRVRHMDRDIKKLKKLYPDWKQYCFNEKLGPKGAYFIGGVTDSKDADESIIDVNEPSTVPGIWCDWELTDDGLQWNEKEKFYNCVPWLKYLIKHFIEPEGYSLTGMIEWQGECPEDFGIIGVVENEVRVYQGMIVYEEGGGPCADSYL